MRVGLAFTAGVVGGAVTLPAVSWAYRSVVPFVSTPSTKIVSLTAWLGTPRISLVWEVTNTLSNSVAVPPSSPRCPTYV